MSDWTNHVERWKDCQDCALGCQRSRIVLARGAIPCDVLFVGEAPGVSEDALGQPFVGPAGKLLDKVIEAARVPIGETRWLWSYAFTNLVACFPREAKATGDHQPAPDEIKACRQRLKEFVKLARPRLIVCVGTLARDWLDPKRRESLDLGLPQVSIVHPAFILRMPEVAQSGEIKRCILRIKNASKELV